MYMRVDFVLGVAGIDDLLRARLGVLVAVEDPDRSMSAETQTIAQIVYAALEIHGSDAATVEVGWRDAYEGWSISVRPARPGAAPLEIGLDRYGAVNIVVANASMDFSLSTLLITELATIAEHVFAGRVEEIGPRRGSFVRIGEGENRISFGELLPPLPRRLRRVRRFIPYS